MTWIATDNFDTDPLGADLDANSGGSGWTGNWVLVSATLSIETAPAGGQGGRAVRDNADQDSEYTRAFSALTEGILSFQFHISSTSPGGDFKVVLDEGGAGRAFANIASDGNLKIYNNGTGLYETIAAYTANAWHTVQMQFDNVAQPGKYRIQLNGGTWSPWVAVNSGSYTSLNSFRLDAETGFAAVLYIDDIKPGSFETSTGKTGINQLGRISQPITTGFAA